MEVGVGDCGCNRGNEAKGKNKNEKYVSGRATVAGE